MHLLWKVLDKTLGAHFLEDRKLHKQIQSLSELFTVEREQLPADYFTQPELKNAYLAYYLPLNFLKISELLEAHGLLWKSFDFQNRVFRIVDFGCGPATASLALLEVIKKKFSKLPSAPAIELHLVDSQPEVLKIAEDLVKRFCAELKIKIKIIAESEYSASGEPIDFLLSANVLNEIDSYEPLLELLKQTSGVFFVMEPSHRVSSQKLIRFREAALKSDDKLLKILGPCLHQKKCPLARTKHWCHFSEPMQDGRLLDLNLRVFKNPRLWLKFSYLLITRSEKFKLDIKPNTYRAIGDVHQNGPEMQAIDLCVPVEKRVLCLPPVLTRSMQSSLVRGSKVTLATKLVEGKITIPKSALRLTKPRERSG